MEDTRGEGAQRSAGVGQVLCVGVGGEAEIIYNDAGISQSIHKEFGESREKTG